MIDTATILKVFTENIPSGLKEELGWLVWKAIWNSEEEKFTKKPRKLDGSGDGWQLSKHSFDEIEKLYQSGKYEGIGFMPRFPYVAIDIDDCFEDDGMYSPLAKELVDIFESYTERSPSGRGLRIFIKTSKKFESQKKKGLEIFASSGFVTITGNVEYEENIYERTAELEGVIQKYFSEKKERFKLKEVISDGSRNVDLFKYASSLRARGLEEDEILDSLKIINQTRCNPSKDDDELEIIAKSVTRYPAGDIPERYSVTLPNGDNTERHERTWIREIVVNQRPGKTKIVVVTQELAEHIRRNTHYIFVRNIATEGVIRYWYIDGYYKQISDEELKGFIKGYIPLELQRTSDINEVFNLLVTDLNFIHVDRLNADENIINLQNGLLFLDKMELKPHTPEIYSTIQIPCNYDSNALPSENKYFDKFMNHLTTGNEEIKSLLLQYMGVALSNIKGWRMKKALFMVGDGDVGKSQLKELTHRLLGANNCSGIDLETLEKRFGTSTIFNKRLIGSSDMAYATVNELKAFKSITGGDTLSAEFKGKNAFNFVYSGLVWFCCNKLPKFGGDKGDHVYNRIMVCECNNPVPKKDKYLQDKMYSEREYIVSLAIKELQKVIKNDYEFIIPSVMQRAVDKYKVTNNSFLLFLQECTTERKFEKIQDNCNKAILFEVYKAWCKDNNRGYYESKKEAKETLEGLGLADVKTVHGHEYYKKFTLTLNAKREYSGIYGYDSLDFIEK